MCQCVEVHSIYPELWKNRLMLGFGLAIGVVENEKNV
jgi:hypothetical protein